MRIVARRSAYVQVLSLFCLGMRAKAQNVAAQNPRALRRAATSFADKMGSTALKSSGHGHGFAGDVAFQVRPRRRPILAW
ncbi:MAG: hypothetical protein Q7V13_17845 [Phenylobacterium sp.]|uniref:hypothetical protein n=1 Tax=Phenylobacterium sp. TaxID=1871053 RepID=UPI0027168AAE|nr:hypothetical protein [Phenylobacterium sp.]MDO8913698.1 hypothetical protein [Phenylobacterium sp.]